MGFSPKVKEDVLVACARQCCLCKEFKGVKIEIHHIQPKEKGGPDTFENAIPLCFDCHCDVGHYSNNHPKGTKFSSAELIRQRDAWYEIVKSKMIPQKSENLVHSRYVITGEFEVITELFERDLSGLPIKNVLLLETPAWQKAKELFKNQKYRGTFLRKLHEIGANEYSLKYPDAKRIDSPDDEYAFYLHERTPTLQDLIERCSKENLTLYLALNGVDPKRIAKVTTHSESECGGSGRDWIEELYILRPSYFKFLLVTNITAHYMTLNTLDVISGNKLLFSENEFTETDKITFPKMLIEPNQSVLIPLGIFLSEFEEIEIADEFITYSNEGFERTQSFGHGSIKGSPKIEYFNENYLPKSINFEIDGQTYLNEIHSFDFKNLYWIDRSWQCGSCPHLFFGYKNSEIKYQGEIFNITPGVCVTEKFLIKSGVVNLIIAELEQEITYIEQVTINGISKEKAIILKEGDEIIISVAENDLVEIRGYYKLRSKNYEVLPVTKKEKLVRRYIEKLIVHNYD